MKLLQIRQATVAGWVTIPPFSAFDISYPSSLTRRGRVQGGGRVCPTITTNVENALVVYLGTRSPS